MVKGQESKSDRELLRVLHQVATSKAKLLGISSTDYLIGILEGEYAMITTAELFGGETAQDKGADSRRVPKQTQKAAE